MSKEKPQVLQGMRDFLPQQMISRQYVLQTARKVYESFGFEPLDTPCIEYAEVLMGKYGPEADKLIYNFEDRGGRRVGLRYDLTVPLARVVASHGDLPRPFKRYQVGPVWRAERPQKGRYREFTQCDIDIVGANPPAADAEVITAFYSVYEALGLGDVQVRLNHRGLLGATARAAGIPDEQRVIAFRSIDKLDKLPPDAVMEEMAEAGIARDSGRRLLSLLEDARDNLIGVASRLVDDPEGQAAVKELTDVMDLVEAMGLPKKSFGADLTLVRGLDYYTGTILEAVLPELRSSVGGGGRYDNLIGMFGIGSVPTVGASVGLDRIIDVLTERDALPKEKTVVQVLMTVFNSESRPQSLALADDLRKAGLAVETYLLDRPLGKQFAYANGKGIPFAIVIGPDEQAAGTATLRNLRLREQVTVPQGELVERIVA